MSLVTVNAVAELLSVLSGLLLFFPALALNRHLRGVKTAQDQLANPKTELTRAIGDKVKPDLERSRIPEWSPRDQTLLLLAIALFAVSSGMKLFIAAKPVFAGS